MFDDAPLLNTFLAFLYFFLMIMWVWIAITVFIDIFRSRDMGGWAKAFWILFVVIFPFLGVLVYLIARGGKMAEHRQQDYEEAQEQFTQYVREAGGVNVADQLHKLAELKDRGVITEDEFQSQKARLLA